MNNFLTAQATDRNLSLFDRRFPEVLFHTCKTKLQATLLNQVFFKTSVNRLKYSRIIHGFLRVTFLKGFVQETERKVRDKYTY